MRVFLRRLEFELVDRVSRFPSRIWWGADSIIQFTEGLDRTKGWRKGKFALSLFELDMVFLVLVLRLISLALLVSRTLGLSYNLHHQLSWDSSLQVIRLLSLHNHHMNQLFIIN